MTDITDTHRRAKLRGRESVARWRIESASWVGWLYGVSGGVVAIAGVVGSVAQRSPGVLAGAGITVAICAAMAWGIHRMRAGSRPAAVSVVIFGTVMALLSALSHRLSLIDAFAVAALVNGAYGVFELARVRRDASLVPPAPPRRHLTRAGV